MKKFVCTVCGYVHEGDAAPAECPVCHVGADKFKEQGGDFIVPHTNHAFDSYFHINVVLGVMLCRFHPLTDKVGVLVHKVYDALVIFGVLVVLAVALHHFEGSQVHLYGFNNLIANPCR